MRLPTNAKERIDTVDLAEIREIKLRPIQDTYSVRFVFDFPRPSRKETDLIRRRDGEDAAFAYWTEETDRILAETDLNSNRTNVNCSGAVSVEPNALSQSLFVDRIPESWPSFERIIRDCR